MLIINTGNAKGKTTAAIGQIIRSLGHKNRVCLIQLFKGENFYGEQKILAKLENFDFFSYAKEHPFCIKGITVEEVSKQCREAVEKVKELANSDKKYDLIVLDEFNIALRDKFIDENEFTEIIKNLAQKFDIVITGRNVPDNLIEIADLVTEMKEIKHPYRNGVKARAGIEF
ncbi:MAG: cob(I)yrinic acid a,c-diamide adenosyltransferase [Elusimicrobiota bacterium]|jgi:cob(I)alamin adenosyltransferase|nr:cob(I)yrinic acid a,c-diamide adenosyltransferase [Elusimicrobiota bacterium]